MSISALNGVIYDRSVCNYNVKCIGVKATVAFFMYLMCLCTILAQVPFSGICVNLQLAVVHIARHWCFLVYVKGPVELIILEGTNNQKEHLYTLYLIQTVFKMLKNT